MSARLGSSHRGTGEWLLQRVTSLYLAGFALFLLARCAMFPIRDYDAWVGLWHGPVLGVFWVLFWLAMLLHAWVGLRSVWMDYVHPAGLRFLVVLLTGLFLVGLGVWSVTIIL